MPIKSSHRPNSNLVKDLTLAGQILFPIDKNQVTDAQSRRLLLIDDSPDIANLVLEYSKGLFIEIVVAETAAAGLNYFEREVFDAVLMDFHLPDMTGAQATKRLRRWEQERRVPLVAVFALTDLSDVTSGEQMLMAGCTALLGKPLFRVQFLTITRHSRRRTQSRSAARKSSVFEKSRDWTGASRIM